MGPNPSVRVELQRTRPKDPEVAALEANLIVMVEQLNVQLRSSWFGGVPLFGIVPLDASLFPAQWDPGAKFAPCDGRKIVDASSPLHGRALPAIVDDLGTGREIRWYMRIRE